MNTVHYIPEILTDIRRQQSIDDCESLLLTGQQLSEHFGKGDGEQCGRESPQSSASAFGWHVRSRGT